MRTQMVWAEILNMQSGNLHPQVTLGDRSTFGTSWVERGREEGE